MANLKKKVDVEVEEVEKMSSMHTKNSSSPKINLSGPPSPNLDNLKHRNKLSNVSKIDVTAMIAARAKMTYLRRKDTRRTTLNVSKASSLTK